MLFALLLDGDDQLIAAAPAVDVDVTGASYWREIWPRPLAITSKSSVAVRDISDPGLVAALHSLALDDDRLEACRASVEELFELDTSPRPPRSDSGTSRRSPRAA